MKCCYSEIIEQVINFFCRPNCYGILVSVQNNEKLKIKTTRIEKRGMKCHDV